MTKLQPQSVVTVVVVGEALALESVPGDDVLTKNGQLLPAKLVATGVSRVASTSKLLSAGASEVMIEVEHLWPMQNCAVVVMVDVDRVRVRGIFLGPDVLALDSPIAFYKGTWDLGVKLRVNAALRTEQDK